MLRLRRRCVLLCPVSFVIVYIHFLIPVLGQGIVDPDDHNAGNNVFYLSSTSDCGNGLKQIYDSEATIRGYDISASAPGPKSCTIRITSGSIYPGIQLRIEINSMNIQDCTTSLTVYEGQGTTKLGSYDCRSDDRRQPLLTSGDTVTFIMNRDNPDNRNFDIEIRVKAIRGGIDPDFDQTNFFSFQKFEQEAIVGMIGGFYALILIICLGVVFYCNIRYKGLNKKWETHQLATMKTDASFEMRSQVSQPPYSVTSQQRGAASQYSRSYTEPYSRKGTGARSEDGSSVYDHDTKFSQTNLMNDERDRRRDRDRIASQNTTYNDDEEPNNFKEKIITPRWKPNKGRSRDKRPPSFEEATRDRSSEEESEETESETEESSSDNDSTRKRLTTSSDDYSESVTESSQSDNSSNQSSVSGAHARRNKKSKKKPSKARRRRQNSSDDASSQRTEPRRKPQPTPHGPPMHGAAPMPYPGYGHPPPPPGGQFVPVMMAPPSYPPPQYATEQRHPSHAQPAVQPTEPPVYSYLVRRGYTPHDPNVQHNSPAGSVASNQRRGGPPSRREEPDTPLQSGVEYMRR